MRDRPNRFIAVLLVLFIVFGSTGGALAANHACNGGESGMPMTTDHSGHVQSQTGTLDAVVDTGLAGACQDCPSTACNDAVCSANACASGVVAVTNTLLPSLSWRGDIDVSPNDLQISLSERLSSLFRPPRV